MANANVALPGQINQAGATDALYLKVFAGEILASFNRTQVFVDKHVIRHITAGKSASFPALGKTSAGYHTPGTEIVGQRINANERIIVIDDILLTSHFFADIEEAKSHYDYRGEATRQMGEALANAFDRNVAQVGVLAARASGNTADTPGGSVISNAAMKTDSAVLGAALFTAAQTLDEKDVMDSDRFAFVKPAQFYLLAQNRDLINKDYNGSGSLANGTIDTVAGIKLVKTNNLPGSNVTTGPAAYQGDFSNTAALVMNRMAVGTVKLLDLRMQSGYDIRRLGTLVHASYAYGHGILRPNCAVELAVV